MLFNNGVYWDDWTVYKMDRIGLMQHFGNNGALMLVYVHDFLNDSDYSPLLYHWLSFVFLLGIFMFFFKILKQYGCKEITAFFISLLAMLAPYFEIKSTIICMPYPLFLFLFTAGLYMVLDFLENNKKYISLIFGSFFLLVGFFLNSLLPLFLFILTLHFIIKRDFSFDKIKQTNYKTIFSYCGLGLLPFIFWIFKKVFLPIGGAYASVGYNKINIVWKEIPIKYANAFTDNIIGIYKELITAFQDHFSFSIGVFFISIFFSFFVLRNVLFKENYEKSKLLKFMIFGILSFLVVVFPYLVVNKPPSYEGYETRHQVLLPLALSFCLFPVVFVLPENFRKAICIFILSCFLTININANANYLRGWIKIEAVKHNIKFLNENRDGTIFTDGFNGEYNATERQLIFYELNGVFKEILGKEDKFIIQNKSSYNYLSTFLAQPESYNIRDLTENVNEDVVLKVEYGNETDYGRLEIMKSIYYYYFNHDKFKERVENMLSMKYQPKPVIVE